MSATQINGNRQIQAGTILDAQINASAAISTSKLADGANFLKRDGSVALTGNLDANSNKVINLATPTASGDATNKDYVDTLEALDFRKDGSRPATGDFDLDSNKIVNLADPTSANDAANKTYVDTLEALDFRKDGSRAATGDFDLNSNKIINLASPSSANDAANKAYVDGVAQGLQLKQSCRATTTANIDLTTGGDLTVDGVVLVDGDRVLVKDQTAGEENGIYIVDSGSWTRSVDLDEPAELTAGIFTFIEEGALYQDTGWVLVTDNPIVLGTDPQVWSPFSGAGSINAGAGLTQTGSTIDVVSANGGIVVNANDIALTLEDASLSITGSGLKISTGTSGQVLVCNASGIPLAVTLAGDVSSVSAAGSVSLNAATIVKTANVITREVPSGSINGSNVTFTLANTPITGKEEVYLNGILQNVGGGNDYTISSATITFATAPLTGEHLLVNYLK